MTKHDARAVGIRDVLRWWPLVLILTALAVVGSLWSASQQRAFYTASTRLVVLPLAQWDETFIGTSLVRDAGDAKRTAATMAALLNSRRSAEVAVAYLDSSWTVDAVDAAVDVKVTEDTNVIEIVVRAPESARARMLAERFAEAILADRWRTISAELDARIEAIAATTSSDPNDGEASSRLQTLTLIRQEGADPTLKIDSTSPVVRHDPLGIDVVIALATAGGMFVGLLAAVAMARLRCRHCAANGERDVPAGTRAAYSQDAEG